MIERDPEYQRLIDEGKLPDPSSIRLAEGRLYYNECPDCGEQNGGGIEDAKHKAGSYPGSPNKVPCIWCGKGPMKIIYCDESN